MHSIMREIRNNFVEEHVDFARMLAAHLARQLSARADLEELESDALLGLIEAAESFDRERGILFRTYAARRIKGAIIDGLRQRQQLRRRWKKPLMRSLDEIAAGQDGRPQCLAEQVPSRDAPVGSALEIRDEAAHAMRYWDEDLRTQMIEMNAGGLKQCQVAAKHGLSTSTVNARMNQIRALIATARRERTLACARRSRTIHP